MTITVTPDPSFEPPRNAITVAVSPGAVMSSVRVWANDPGGARRDLAEQPAAGFDERTVYDYRCPYEQVVSYGWEAEFVDPGDFSTEFDETWASTSAWTVDSGTWNVSSGVLRNTGTGTGKLHRSLTPGQLRVTLASIDPTGGFGNGGTFYVYADASGSSTSDLVSIQADTGNLGATIRFNGDAGNKLYYIPDLDRTQPITIDFLESSILVTYSTGSKSYPAVFAPSRAEFRYETAGANNARFGALLVEAVGAPQTISETSDPVTLDSHDTWLVHPASPGKSFKLQNVDPLAAGIRTFGDITNRSRTNPVDVMGSDLPVPISSGPRAADELSITIATVSSIERQALRAVLADEVPLLVNVPPSWGADFAVGFYSFLTSLQRRFVGYLSRPQPARMFEIPIVRVGAPIVDVEAVGWTVAAVLAEFASINGTEPSVMGTFDTAADLLVNNRS